MKTVVIGNSVLPLALAGQVAMRNDEVVYVDVSEHGTHRELIAHDCRLIYSGEENFAVRLAGATDSFKVITDAQLILIAPAPSSYTQIFGKIIPFLREGQHICFFPGSFGAMFFQNELEKYGKKGLIVCEAVSFPWVCKSKSPNEIVVSSKKKSLKIAVYPGSERENEIKLYNDLFDIFCPAVNFIETSLENINIVLHPLPILLNIGSVERECKTFRHYIDGVSPIVGDAMEKMDQERLAVGKALGLELTSTLSQLKTYYGDNGFTTISEYVSNLNGPYPLVSGFGLDSRYIREDIPCLVWPMLQIARAHGIDVPITELCIELSKKLLGMEFVESDSFRVTT